MLTPTPPDQCIFNFKINKEDKGFEPLRAFTRLTVFKTVPFSRTWVILREYVMKVKLMIRTGLEPVLPP